tara:strand:+ start:55 stop:312 length:258 start_codon:yes stop_codon:yes gene_type:complete
MTTDNTAMTTSEEQKDKLDTYFEKLEKMKSEDMMSLVDKYLDEEAIEIFVDHIEEFYGVEDDEQLGSLAQIMISGYVAAMETNKK